MRFAFLSERRGQRKEQAKNLRMHELADITHVLLFGGRTKIFKLDVVLELGDRRIVNYHRPGRMPVSAGNFPAKLNMQPRPPSPRRVAAQFNHALERTARSGCDCQTWPAGAGKRIPDTRNESPRPSLSGVRRARGDKVIHSRPRPGFAALALPPMNKFG